MTHSTKALVATAACLALGSRFGVLHPPSEAAPAPLPLEYVTIQGELFSLEVAADEETRTRGLMERPEISPDKGMIFVFPNEEERTFWMAHTLAELDIVFLDRKGRVTALHTMPPEEPQGELESEWHYHQRLKRYPSNTPAQFAVEFKAGTLSLLKIEVGDLLPIDVDRLAAMAR
ncbi:MAG: DUF192 domain-containing protein [Lentisphaerae bacterium]|jgi:uncharacterized protein|nr:DUF192 domain-containing protein [Lentisphaerota bacterium]MBT4817294.1 DUF192 domain-containing protein [Lentisphaerota bacterium]MBT5607727.1 DUF192 domain-containing protein [Lentisphaerota bacterium]MBT7054890.1 DUF192 domain-containing protein [Lentisphaerota bacterium]MBT7843340.1 DUF192 domain-containing protein [Lentisphaerota bacterium]